MKVGSLSALYTGHHHPQEVFLVFISVRAFLFRGIIMRFARDMQLPCKRVSLSIGTLMGNVEGVRLPGFLEKGKNISGFLSGTQRTLRF